MINNNNIDLLRTRKYYTPFEFLNIISGTTRAAQGDMLLSATDDATDLLELGTLNDSGVVVLTLQSGIRFFSIIPSDVDPRFPIGFRLNYSVLKTTDPITLSILGGFAAQEIVAGSSTALSLLTFSATGALININGLSNFIDYGNYWSNRLTKKFSFTKANLETGALFAFYLVINASTNISAVYILGLEIDYVPQLCNGQSRDLDCPLNVSAQIPNPYGEYTEALL